VRAIAGLVEAAWIVVCVSMARLLLNPVEPTDRPRADRRKFR
jgi:hypothetical protein